MTLGIRHKSAVALALMLSVVCVAGCGNFEEPPLLWTPTPLPTPCPGQLCDVPTPVLEARDDCSVDPGIPTNYEVAFTGSKPGRILFEVETDFSPGQAGNEYVRSTEVWAVDEDGDNLTNLTRMNGTTPSGLTSYSQLASVSPDGLQLAFVVKNEDQSAHLSVMDTYGKGLTQLTRRETDVFTQILSLNWTADSSRLAYTVREMDFRHEPTLGFSNSYLIKADGSDIKSILNSPSGDASTTLPLVYLSLSHHDNYVAFSVDWTRQHQATYISVQNRIDGELLWKLHGVSDQDLKWSPNDEMIALETGGDVYVVQSDGSCHLNVTALIEDRFGKNPFELNHLVARRFVKFVWSHDSQKLAIINWPWIYVANIGSPDIQALDLRSISDMAGLELSVQYKLNPWAKDNQRFLLSKSYSAHDSGVVLVDVTSGGIQVLWQEPETFATNASWSPDGSKIVFVRDSIGGKNQIMIMDSDGSELRPITPGLDFDLSSPIWIRQSPE